MINSYIIVDDDGVNNLICMKVIRRVVSESLVNCFQEPDLALAFIKETFKDPDTPETILFLDINMPIMNGWDFLKVFNDFDEGIREMLNIYMLSSSVDQRDRIRAQENPYVIGYIEKPLTVEKFSILLKSR
jgi:two-component SAPR family response regulator